MTLYHILIVALIQGLTEWLPISSSAHLALLPALTPLPDQGLLIDAMAHLGSLMAVIVYFRADISRILSGCRELASRWHSPDNPQSANAKMTLHLIVATPPALIAGACYAAFALDTILRHTYIIAGASIGFGLILWLADRQTKPPRPLNSMTGREAFWIGMAQICALIPGASRSGITISAALALGFSRTEAARFSMLIGIPILTAAGGYSLLKMALNPDQQNIHYGDGLMVAALSFIAALISIGAMMALLKRISFLPFILYRIILGATLLILPASS